MNPEKELTPREQLEVHLTALLMGELPPAEEKSLQAQIAADPELAALHGRLRHALELLREAKAFPDHPAPLTPLQLSNERRERLLAHFKIPVPAPASAAGPAPVVALPRRDWSWIAGLGVAAALIVFLGAGLLMNGLVQRKAALAGSQAETYIRLRNLTKWEPGAQVVQIGAINNENEGTSLSPSKDGYQWSPSAMGQVVPAVPYKGLQIFNGQRESTLTTVTGGSPTINPGAAQHMVGAAGSGSLTFSGGSGISGTTAIVSGGLTTAGVSSGLTFPHVQTSISGGQVKIWSSPIDQSQKPPDGNIYLGQTAAAVAPNPAPGSAITLHGGTLSINGTYAPSDAREPTTRDNDTGSANTYSGGTTINAGTLSVDTGGTSADGGIGLAARQPGQNEYQRYPGRPATTSLGATFESNLGSENLYILSPRPSFGGSATTVYPSPGDFDAGLGSFPDGFFAGKQDGSESKYDYEGRPVHITGNTRGNDKTIRRTDLPASIFRDIANAGVVSTATTGNTNESTAQSEVSAVTGNTRTPSLQPTVELKTAQPHVPGNEHVFFGGGTSGTALVPNAADYPFVAPGASPGGTAGAAGSTTSGNRSGNLGISANAIDALLFPTTTTGTSAPASGGVAGTGDGSGHEPNAPGLPPLSAFDPAPPEPEADGPVRQKTSASKGGGNGLEKQRKQVENAETLVAQIRERDGIVDSEPDEERSNIGYQQGERIFTQTRLDEQRLKVVELARQLEMINNLHPDELREALRMLNIDDPTVARTLPLLQDAIAEEAKLTNSGLSVDHPRIKALEAKKEAYSKILNKQLSSIRATQSAKLQQEKDKLSAVESASKDARTQAIEEKAKLAKYIDAKNKYLQAKQTLESMETEEVSSKAKTAPDTAIPQPEIQTSINAFSTFSLNVSDVSFKLAAASLEQGKMPEPSSVRSEEFINAFDYHDSQAAPGAPLAFATERARYPFAQNRDLLRFAVKTAAAGREPGRPLNIVLVLDKSGSMERADRVNIVREALRVLTAQLQPQDKLSIVTFARTPRLWADGVAGDKAGEMIARVGEITPEGGTNLEAALNLGYATALRHFAVGNISRVVLFTDGAANLGDVNPEALQQKVEAYRKKGVALDCFGIGWEGYNDDLLEELTRHGDGRYGFINTPEEATANFATQLAGALHVAAADVKVQVEFNPRRVTAYRQIGYAKHQLTKEQFRDNSVDAAEIGAEESGNALYVVEVNPKGEGDLATVRVRFKVPGTSDYREHEWTVPFTGNAGPLKQASPALRLAGTAAAFSEMLADNPYAGEVTDDRLLGLINGVPAIYSTDPRPAKLEWMIRQAKSLSGR